MWAMLMGIGEIQASKYIRPPAGTKISLVTPSSGPTYAASPHDLSRIISPYLVKSDLVVLAIWVC